jgi:hypothetical protein
MSSTSETGHAKNVANFNDLVAVCIGLGVKYNPGKASIKLKGLNEKLLSSKECLKLLNKVTPVLTNAVNEREKIYEPLTKLAARINGAVASSDVPDNLPADVMTLTRKLTGRRSTPKKDDPPKDPQNPGEEGPKNISVSQLSFDSRLENLEKVIELLAVQTGYAPNEADLSIDGLKDRHAQMDNANNAVLDAEKPVVNARAARNTELYHPKTGIIKVANDVKSYVKSVFTMKSPEYKQLSKLQFIKPRGK